jgi:hypothetical protein
MEGVRVERETGYGSLCSSGAVAAELRESCRLRVMGWELGLGR